jgi:hypothetical protein
MEKVKPTSENSGGMDECDTAARVMECGKNAFPEMFDNMITAVDYTAVV